VSDRPEPLSAPRRVLIIKPSSLGDVVTAVPVLRGLRRTFPAAWISWLITPACAPLVRHDPDLDEIISFDRPRLGCCWRSPGAAAGLLRLVRRLRRERFDWVIDLQGLLRSGLFAAVTRAPLRAGFADAREGAGVFYTHAITPTQLHTVDRNIELARHLGIDARGEEMTLRVGERGRAFARSILGEHGLEAGTFWACLPPARWPTKRYPVRHWRRVVSELSRRTPVVLLGAPGEQTLCGRVAEGQGEGVIDLSGRTGVEEMVAVLSLSRGVICSDSAAKFIASAVGVDVLCLIGPTRVERTGPYGGGRTLVAPVRCQGCLKRRCPHVTCMQLIRPEDVIDAAAAIESTAGA